MPNVRVPTVPTLLIRFAALAVSLAAAACAATAQGTRPALAAQPGEEAATPPKPPGAPGAAGAAKPQEAGALKPFADVIKEATEAHGFFTLWKKDEKVWIEIRPDQLDQPFFFGEALASGLGEFHFLPGLLGDVQAAVFHRVGNRVQLIARNLLVRAPAGTPLAVAVRESYSDSLLASADVVSAPQPERKSFLVDANALLGADIPGLQTMLEASFHLSYALDARNTGIERIRATDSGTSITVRAHYAVPRLPAPPTTPPAPGTPRPKPPRSLPDPRSLFLDLTYNLVPLPAEPMRPRLADQRVGHFTIAFRDFGNELGGDHHTHYIYRWRLEKKDPAAAVSEPKEPIVAWLDRNIPEKYRDAVRAGVLEWNKAFERAGFKDAIVVKQQAADDSWSTLEGTRHLAVRWFAMEGPGALAVGPSQADPRTGEILNATAIIPANWVRVTDSAIADYLPAPPAADSPLARRSACDYATAALEETAFGLDLLEARGWLDPSSPEAERLVRDSLKDVVMHEVGHTLGLRHNFRASATVPAAELRDAAYVHEHGLAPSVMDYLPLNIPLEGEAPAAYIQTTIGAYDYWAIEYAYREFPPDQEAAGLAAIAGRSANDPSLAYATDEDAGGPHGGGIDPTVNQFDLGDDPLAYYARRFKLSRELWTRTESRVLKPEDNYEVYRRNLQRGLGEIGRAVPLIAKYIGGEYTARDLAATGRPLLSPVSAARQREALELLARGLFSDDSFRFDPGFMSRLGVDLLDRGIDESDVRDVDFNLSSAVLGIQRAALDQLMSDGVAARMASAQYKVADASTVLSPSELQSRLASAIWSELKTGSAVDGLRRSLQREHLRRIAGALVRPDSTVAPDLRGVLRQVALGLQSDLQRALHNPRLDPATKAHLDESLATVTEALKAPLIQQGT